MICYTMKIYEDIVINHQNSTSYQLVMGPTQISKTSYYDFDQTISSQFQYFLLPRIGKTDSNYTCHDEIEGNREHKTNLKRYPVKNVKTSKKIKIL